MEDAKKTEKDSEKSHEQNRVYQILIEKFPDTKDKFWNLETEDDWYWYCSFSSNSLENYKTQGDMKCTLVAFWEAFEDSHDTLEFRARFEVEGESLEFEFYAFEEDGFDPEKFEGWIDKVTAFVDS